MTSIYSKGFTISLYVLLKKDNPLYRKLFICNIKFTKNILRLNKLVIFDPVTKNWPLPFQSFIEAQEFIKKEMDSELSYQYFMDSLVETINGNGMMFSVQAISEKTAFNVFE